METIQVTVYQFDELEPEAQNKVLSQFSDINVDHDWWEFLYEEFKEELREVYHQIDTSSNLLWSHDNGLVRPKRREVKRRNRDNFVCEDPYYMKLNQKADKPEEVQGFNWKTDSTAQIGYGEITKGAMLKFFNILQNIDQFFKPEHEEFMKYKKEEYRLTADDTFIDVGSGFGKPVFHAAMQVG